MNNEIKLNTRQWTLYNCIKQSSHKGDSLSRRDIQVILNAYYPIIDDNLFHDKNARLITKDIQKINDCPTIQKIIISDSTGIKIANEEETFKYIEHRKMALKKEIKRLYGKIGKAKRNNQGRLKFTEFQREFVESFID